jgi:hypothetical protein
VGRRHKGVGSGKAPVRKVGMQGSEGEWTQLWVSGGPGSPRSWNCPHRATPTQDFQVGGRAWAVLGMNPEPPMSTTLWIIIHLRPVLRVL